MFARLLVANRGEIAVRVLQACAELGVTGIAVFAPDDAGALHVRRADVALPLEAGEGSGRTPYLDVAAVVRAARQSGAEALHPGYGFLSERPELAAACHASGIAFVGPPAEAMRLLGDKARAKGLARSLGVPVLPGFDEPGATDEQLLLEARGVGFPLLTKASAGGGGRGIRRVDRHADLAGALAAARREALAAFGDDAVYLEGLAPRARHVEVQVLADAHGSVVHLGERDCSVQRRHQKVIEECPSPTVAPALRERLGEEAVRLFRAAGYRNAGTAEFLLTEDGEHAFLEVNTRLQVEHPVTEAVTGIDLVREQIRIAAGLPLSVTQEQVSWRGHAVQCRVYAEDARAGFLPSAGPVLLFDAPHGAGIRIDAGVETGDDVSPRYDPLLAKLTVWASDRQGALAGAGAALRRCAVLGVATNLDLLKAVVGSAPFAASAWDTETLEARLPELLPPTHAEGDERLPAALVAATGWRLTAQPDAPAGVGERLRASLWQPWQRVPWRLGGQGVPLRFATAGGEVRVTAWRREEGWEIDLLGTVSRVRFRRSGPHRLLIQEGTEQRVARVVEHQGALHLSIDGTAYVFTTPELPDEPSASGATPTGAPRLLVAPVPGVVVRVDAAPGDAVESGQPLIVLEAMKMEFAVVAPQRGVVRRVDCAPGERVAAGATLAELEA